MSKLKSNPKSAASQFLDCRNLVILNSRVRSKLRYSGGNVALRHATRKFSRALVTGALPLAIAVTCADVASAAPVAPVVAGIERTTSYDGHDITFVDDRTMTIDGHTVTVDNQNNMVRVDNRPVSFRSVATPAEALISIDAPIAGPDKVGTGALVGAGIGAAAAGIPAAVVGAIPGAVVGGVIGAGAGFLIGIGTVAAGVLIGAMVGCVTTGCIIDVPVFLAGLAAEAVIAAPSIAIGAVAGVAIGAAIGAGIAGLPAAGIGGLVGAGIGAAAVTLNPQLVP
ncbi:hypothetical protein ACFVAV_03215 [Nocardia sp. NPDC057663]|uniref:hypothetical protein n=1 Tax=Nocardia sp. NPDC057663 TaxID=3346201 RepID=UPI00367179A7